MNLARAADSEQRRVQEALVIGGEYDPALHGNAFGMKHPEGEEPAGDEPREKESGAIPAVHGSGGNSDALELELGDHRIHHLIDGELGAVDHVCIFGNDERRGLARAVQAIPRLDFVVEAFQFPPTGADFRGGVDVEFKRRIREKRPSRCRALP